jgi:hypothetical protein
VVDGGLHAEAVQDGPEDLLVVEAVRQARVALGLRRNGAVDDALIQVGSAEAPDLAGEVDVVGVVDLREMVPATGLLRERQNVLAAVVFDLDVALFDVDVGLPVLAHRAELDEVTVRHVLVDREEHVEVADDVVVLRVDRVAPIDHRVGRSPLLGVVHDRVRLVAREDFGDELPVQQVAVLEPYRLAADLLPGLHALLRVGDRREALGPELVIYRPADEVVDDDDLVPRVR